ncbi:unnamed protein product [Clavelina lepadiformis]|uniref:G-protein coupled receptor n=1 Tax=Clavelina lepadiformis TaxID=159417 RepID=A0ABP0F3V0_CLALP
MKAILSFLILNMVYNPSISAPIDCGFENDNNPFCGFNIDGWTRVDGSTIEGLYFIRKNYGELSANLTLDLSANASLELSFYYVCNGCFFQLIEKSSDKESTIWSTTSSRNIWEQVKVLVSGDCLTFRARGVESSVFLDDIKFQSPNSTTTLYTSSMTTQATALTDVSTPGLTETVCMTSSESPSILSHTPGPTSSTNSPRSEPIEKIIHLESTVSVATTLSVESSTKVVKAVGNIALSRNNLTRNTTQRLLRILDQVADKVNVSDGEVFNATTPNVFVAVVNLPKTNSTNEGFISGVGLKVVNQNNSSFTEDSFSLYFEEDNTNQSSIFIPYEVINKSKDGKVSLYSFLGDSFFRTNASLYEIELKPGFEETLVNSDIIISATILDSEISTQNLTDKITISFHIKENTSIFGSSFCGFWVEDGSYWSSEGCTKLSSSEQLLRCECNHLTNFASLFAYGNLTHDKGLDVLTYIGCSISAIASLFTIIALLIIWVSTKNHMNKNSKFLMLNLSLSLFLLNILILISEIPGVRSDEGKCKALAGTLHFALISAFLWMFAQAVYVFISINKVKSLQNNVKN